MSCPPSCLDYLGFLLYFRQKTRIFTTTIFAYCLVSSAIRTITRYLLVQFQDLVTSRSRRVDQKGACVMSASYHDNEGTTHESDLCGRCLNIPFDLFLGEQRTYELYGTRLELKSSAKHCVACNFWDRRLSSRVHGDCRPESPVFLSSLGGRKIQNGFENGANVITTPLDCRVELSDGREISWGDADYFTSSSLSRDSIELMKALIDDCINSHDHPLCRGFREFSDAPSRLLFVGDVADPRLRVIRTSELSEVPVYVALSHCWGSVAENAPWKLNRTSVVGFQHEIPESFLPPTFVDAVKVTRGLGQSYLWIDSLCILQDCSVDWELESNKMGGIYANALCTLGSASDSTYGGCAGVRSRSDNLKLRLALGTITFYLGSSWETENSPISRRAWCLQERVLARRFIQFADLGFMWFCARQSVLEYNFLGSTSPENLDLPLLERRKDNCHVATVHYPLVPMGCDLAPRSPSQAPGRKSSLVQGWDIKAHSKLYDYWYTLVVLYSGRKITKSSDRLPAIAGLAEQVARRLPEDLYIMGLWLFDLSNGLLWRSWEPGHRKSRREIAPSWSWLSCDMVRYLRRFDETESYGESRAPTFFFLSALDKNISPFPLLRVLGSLVSVECVAVECIVNSASSISKQWVRVCDQRLPCEEPQLDPSRQRSMKVYWDLEVEPSYLDRTFPCLICAIDNDDGYGYPRGLVLEECVSPDIKLYRRMGVFEANYLHGYWRDGSVSEKLCGLEREEIYIK